VGEQYVGIDLHKRRSVIVRVDGEGNRLETTRIENSPAALLDAVGSAGVHPEVVVEATAGWYWVVDTLVESGASVHLAHPSALNWGHRRVKNDQRDASDLVDMLRLDRLPESWIAPAPVRELRELVRYRHKLVQLRAGLKSQIQGVLTKRGAVLTRRKLWGVHGPLTLDELPLEPSYRTRVDSLRRLIAALDGQVRGLEGDIADWLVDDVGYRAVQTIRGVGPVLGAVFVAEIGDIRRFAGPDRLCSWAGLTPRHRESDTTVHRGRITKMGSRLVRWAAVEAISRGRDTSVAELYARVAVRRGVNVARVAAARKLLHLVYYGLRDGEIRCLAETG
jgi:transposase